MSSLAFYAAPIDNNDSSAGNTQIEKKKISRNKTLKKRNSNLSQKIPLTLNPCIFLVSLKIAL